MASFQIWLVSAFASVVPVGEVDADAVGVAGR